MKAICISRIRDALIFFSKNDYVFKILTTLPRLPNVQTKLTTSYQTDKRSLNQHNIDLCLS